MRCRPFLPIAVLVPVLFVAVLTIAPALSQDAPLPQAKPIDWRASPPDQLWLRSQVRRRYFGPSIESSRISDTNGLLSRAVGQTSFQVSGSFKSEFRTSVVPRRVKPREIKGELIYEKERWMPRLPTHGFALTELMNRARKLRRILPEERAPKIGEVWSLPYARFRGYLGLNYKELRLSKRTPGTLRFVGLRSWAGVLCQCFSVSLKLRQTDAPMGLERSVRIGGVILMAQATGLPMRAHITVVIKKRRFRHLYKPETERTIYVIRESIRLKDSSTRKF